MWERQATRALNPLQGLLAGLIAGLLMSCWMLAADAARGAAIWRMPRLISTIVLGAGGYGGGPQFEPLSVIVGLVLHQATSAWMGLLYAALLRPARLRDHPLATSLGYALVSWAIFQYAIMPWLAPTMRHHSGPLELAVAHVVFGLALGLYPIWSRSRFNKG